MVAVEEVLLTGRVVGEAATKAAVEGGLGIGFGGNLVLVLPPGLEVSPAEAVFRCGAVVDQGVVAVADDLDVVVHGGLEAYVGLGERGEDDVLRLTVPGQPGGDHAEARVAALCTCLPKLDRGTADVGVDRGDEVPLRGFVEKDVGGDQCFEEPGEPGVAGFEGAQVLEEVLGRPVPRVTEDVLLDA
ncbi:hypothetical protein NJL88_05225 [Streptomyces sp. DK15]|nr:hypothetical protein [Streptomyces sp. DK15]MDX2389479.1 hypothetical protein [Streptomyces sp. DK15]